jgi:hypothetical protein
VSYSEQSSWKAAGVIHGNWRLAFSIHAYHLMRVRHSLRAAELLDQRRNLSSCSPYCGEISYFNTANLVVANSRGARLNFSAVIHINVSMISARRSRQKKYILIQRYCLDQGPDVRQNIRVTEGRPSVPSIDQPLTARECETSVAHFLPVTIPTSQPFQKSDSIMSARHYHHRLLTLTSVSDSSSPRLVVGIMV